MRTKLNNFYALIQKANNYINKNIVKSILICYVGVTLFFIIFAALIGFINFMLYSFNYYTTAELNVNSFEHVGIEVVNEHTLITQTDDSQLILSDVGNIKSLHMRLNYSQLPGEINLFYASDEHDDFSANKMLYAQYKDGYYTFNLPLGTKKIRFDCGVHASNTIEITDITLNRNTFLDLVPFNTNVLFLIMVLPLIIIPCINIFAIIIQKKQKA